MYNPALASYDPSKDSWYSPIRIIQGFHYLGQRYGDNIYKSDFKRAREMFTAAVTLLGAYEFSPENKYFLQLNRQSSSPDVMAGNQAEVGEKGILLELMQIEVTEFEEHFLSDDIVEFLRATKLSPKKGYGDKMVIVCLVNRVLPLNHRDVAEKVKALNPKSTIYILGRAHREDPAKFVIFSPFPRLTKLVKYDVFETAQKYQLPYRVKFHKGSAKKILYEKTHLEPANVYNMFDLDERKVEAKYKHG